MNTFGLRNFALTLLDLFAGLVTLILGFAFVLQLFGANSTTPFVAWIYSLSGSLASPFTGIFPDIALSRGAVIDVAILISLVVYVLLFYILHVLVDSLFTTSATHTTLPPHTHYV